MINKTHFAVLGHNNLLAVSEINQVLKTNIELEQFVVFGKTIAFSDTFLDCKDISSIAFSGELIASFDELSKDLFIQAIVEKAEKRKVNIFTNFKISFDLGQIRKTTNIKSLNIKVNDFPNYGHFQTFENFIIVTLDKRYYILKVLSFTNQFRYKFIDENLPHSDLKKGVINLKLASSLLNFTDNKIILDPFAGFGRIAFSDLTSERKFYLTDIDKECQKYIQENVDFLVKQRSSYELNINPENINLIKAINFVELAKDIDKYIQEESFSIVTEGSLGRNFGRKVPLQAVLHEQKLIFNLWEKIFISLAKNSKLQDIVFCVPYSSFYSQSSLQIAKFISYIEQDYSHIKFQKINNNDKVLYYSRNKSFIGHAILKVSLVR